jgi:lipopolysaccharide transport system ATP-binding protein
MSTIVIQANGVSKRYRIGVSRGRETLRERLQSGMQSAYRNGTNQEPPSLFWALRNVSFSVREGEVLGIIGRNGAGKSTLLKILARITDPTEGRVELHGRVGSLLEVGTGFHPELTGRENIYLNGTMLGMRQHEIRRRFDAIVDFADIERFLDTPVKRYSSGMYTRLAFAVAAHLEPEILIVDEVLAVGDAAFQEKCMGKMREVAGNGRTILYVSHSLPSIAALCHHALWLDEGQVKGYGTARSIVGEYLGSVKSKSHKVLEYR